MKTLAKTLLLLLVSIVLYGQDLTGQWNGSLHVQGTQLRIVLHVSEINDQLEATVDSPDQNATGIKVTSISFNYPHVKFEISNLGAVFEGLITDNRMTGEWLQSGTGLFLAFVKSVAPAARDK